MSPTYVTEVRAFGELTTDELYGLLRLRSEAFVVEQACVYQDLDGLDAAALHLLTTGEDGLAAYARLLPPGTPGYDAAAGIGRVVTAAAYRGAGLGRQLVRRGVGECQRRWPGRDVVLHAQSHLLAFYGSCGFRSEGDEYLETGLPHRVMRLAAKS